MQANRFHREMEDTVNLGNSLLRLPPVWPRKISYLQVSKEEVLSRSLASGLQNLLEAMEAVEIIYIMMTRQEEVQWRALNSWLEHMLEA
jgi:hypothetical protein